MTGRMLMQIGWTNVTAIIDANILVYTAGIRADARRACRARELLERLRPDACLSLEVLSEFSAVALRHGVGREDCRAIVAESSRSRTVLLPTASTLETALDGVRDHRLSFWDAMLWAMAQENDLAAIVKEDGPTGAIIGGVTFRSPFVD